MPETAALLPLARRGVFETYRREGAREWIQATGDSMRPLIEPGAWLRVQFGKRPERVGQIVLFTLDGTVVAHRLVARLKRDGTDLWIAKGDAELVRDPPLLASEVLGVVDTVSPRPDCARAPVGCEGASARVMALSSFLASRLAAVGWRAARCLPDPLRRPVSVAVAAFAGMVGWAGTMPVAWLASRQMPTQERG
jgi:Peptidase S24-like